MRSGWNRAIYKVGRLTENPVRKIGRNIITEDIKMKAETERPFTAVASRKGQDENVLLNFLDTSYDKVEDKSIFIEFATGAYPAMCVALAKAKLVQIEKGGAI
jgi:hypothetical protein